MDCHKNKRLLYFAHIFISDYVTIDVITIICHHYAKQRGII